MSNIIEIKNLKKSYKDVKAVKGIDFYVEEGKLFALLGPNGAGKSTTPPAWRRGRSCPSRGYGRRCPPAPA